MREASGNGYYLYSRQVAVPPSPADSRITRLQARLEKSDDAVPEKLDGRRFLKTMVFWIIIVLIPIIMIQLVNASR